MKNRIALFIPLFLGALAVTTLIVSCGGGDGDKISVSQGEDRLSDEQDAYLDSVPKLPPLAMSEIILPSGRTAEYVLNRFTDDDGRASSRGETPLTPLDRKEAFITSMLKVGEDLCNRSNHHFDADDDGPEQNGIAYSFGSKQYVVRKKPSASCCPIPVHGLDCSGFVKLCVTTGRVPLSSLPEGTGGQKVPENWKFPSSWGIHMEDVGSNPDGGYKTGDVLCYSSAHNHIGIVDGGAVLQSNGKDGCSKDSEELCRLNRTRKGANRIALGDFLSSVYFGTPNHVLRIVADSGFEVQLDWATPADVDLHVFEPNGTQVYFGNKTGADGHLDVDDTSQVGPEHYILDNEPKDGDYRVGVVYYRGDGPNTARITITSDATVQTFTQQLTTSTGGASPIMVANVKVSTDAKGKKKVEITGAGRGRVIPFNGRGTITKKS